MQGISYPLLSLPLPIQYDAGVVKIDGIPVALCNGAISPEISITNIGTETLTSIDINYTLNNDSNLLPWTGNLPSGVEETVALPEISFELLSENIFEIYTSNPNGNEDQNNVNDTAIIIFSNSHTLSSVVYLEFYTDNSPEESTWKIENIEGQIIANGGPYNSLPSYFIYDTISLPSYDCYKFIIEDSGNNGICCGNGNGFYNLRDQNDNSVIEKYCYDDDTLNCNQFGGLYQWDEVMRYDTIDKNQGICPDGWRLPSNSELNEFINEIGGPTVAGSEMKVGGSSGFDLLFGGLRNDYALFSDLGIRGYLWTSSQIDNLSANYRYIDNSLPGVYGTDTLKSIGLPVRCVKGLPTLIDSNVVIIDSLVYELISDSLQLAQGIYTYVVNASKKKEKDIIVNNDIIIGETDEGYLRRVTNINQINNTLTLYTEPSDMEELFQSAEFDFEMNLDNTVPVKSSLSKTEVLYLAKGVTLDNTEDGGFEYNFANVELFNNGTIDLSISNGHLKFEPNYKFVFKYKKRIVNKLAFYTENSLLELYCDIDLSVDQSTQLIDYEKLLASYKKVSWFMVGWLPVGIAIQIDLKAISNLDLDASFNATTGYINTNLIDIGSTYESGQWSKILNINNTQVVHPITMDGMVNIDQSVSIIPEVSIRLYGVAGPYFNMGIYENLTGNITSPDLNWNAKLDVGLNSSIGANVTIFGKTLADYNKNIFGFNTNIWEAPYEISIVSGNNQTGLVGQTLSNPVVVKVSDNLDNPVPIQTPVDFEIIQGGGSTGKSLYYTDENGQCSTYWTLGQDEEINMLSSTVVNSNGDDIHNSPLNISAYGYNQEPELPVVETGDVLDFYQTWANINGIVTSEGSSPVTARGICYSTSENPTLANTHTVDGAGLGSFTSNLIGLTSGGVKYYFRAYATNYEGTQYGNEYYFCTYHNSPSLYTGDVVHLHSYYGINDANAIMSAFCNNCPFQFNECNQIHWYNHGFYFAEHPNPTQNDDTIPCGMGGPQDYFQGAKEMLVPNSKYYYRAFMRNDFETILGEVKSFTTQPIVITNGIERFVDHLSINSEVLSLGSQEIFERGVCWNETGIPTIEDNLQAEGSGLGTFTNDIYGLTPVNYITFEVMLLMNMDLYIPRILMKYPIALIQNLQLYTLEVLLILHI